MQSEGPPFRSGSLTYVLGDATRGGRAILSRSLHGYFPQHVKSIHFITYIGIVATSEGGTLELEPK